MKLRKKTRFLAAGAAIALVASLTVACGSDSDTADSGSSDTNTSQEPTSEEPASEEPASEEPTSEEPASEEPASEEPASEEPTSEEPASSGVDYSGDTQKDITIPIASGWDEDVAVTNLYKYVLEQKGFTVETPTLAIAPIFDGVSTNAYDFFFDTWLPNTHKDYWAKYGDKVQDLGVWYDNAPLTIAVPDYMDIDSLADLKSIGDKVDKTITGIDPGAGLSRVTKEDMMPAYGLDDWNLKLSSTAAMLAALKNATEAKEPIVVTLWRPHWAYAAFPIKDLKDPKGAMGEPDQIHTIGSNDFVAANPGLTDVLKNFTMDADMLGALEISVLQDHEDDPQAGVEAWLKDDPANQAYVDGLFGK